MCKDCSDGGLGPVWYPPELHIWGQVLHWRTWRHDRGPRMVWSQTGSQRYVYYKYVYNMLSWFAWSELCTFFWLSQMKLGLVCILWRTVIPCRRHTPKTVAWPRPLASLTFSWALVTLGCSTHPAPVNQLCLRRWRLTAEYLALLYMHNVH